ncbi:VanZ family protein [Flavisolibacter sp. BT320]|nr:VanZ family protein [Flavisolibacter longurius]
MLQKLMQSRVVAFLWLFIITILFLLPGSALPKNEMLIPHFDKYVHVGFFAVLLFLWRLQGEPSFRFGLLLLLPAFVYGLGIEYIQHYFIANRSFDMGDVIADMVGAVAGVLVAGLYKKNRPL